MPIGDGAGWVLTDHELRHTDDDGATWRAVDLASFGRPAAWAFVDATTTVLASSVNGALVVTRTNDGGASMQATTVHAAPGETQPSLSFIDRARGYLALSSVPEGDIRTATVRSSLYRTNDGGVTWSLIAATSPVTRVAFSTALVGTGTGTGASSGLYLTRDGGLTWQRLHPPGWDGHGPAGEPSYELAWQDDQQLVIESMLATAMMVNLAFLETRDGGATWRRIDLTDGASPYSGTGPQPQLAVIDPPRLRILLPTTTSGTYDGGYALRASDDLGATWTTIATMPCLNTPRVRYATTTRVWITSQPAELHDRPQHSTGDHRPQHKRRPNLDGRDRCAIAIGPRPGSVRPRMCEVANPTMGNRGVTSTGSAEALLEQHRSPLPCVECRRAATTADASAPAGC